MVALSIDAGTSGEAVERFYEETGLTSLPFYHDGTMKSFVVSLKKSKLAPGLPTTMFVDAQRLCARGVLRKARPTGRSPDAKALVEAAKG